MMLQRSFSSSKAWATLINDTAWDPSGASENNIVVWKQLLRWEVESFEQEADPAEARGPVQNIKLEEWTESDEIEREEAGEQENEAKVKGEKKVWKENILRYKVPDDVIVPI